jgi:hypothetical protein
MGGVSWQDVQDLPSDIHAYWLAFRAGEAETRREVESERAKQNQTRYV